MTIPPWMYAAAAGLAVAGGFAAGWTVQGWRWAAADAERLEAEVRAKDDQLARQDEIATDYEQSREQGRVEAHTRETTIREIYRDVEVPADCEPEPGALRVLDQAVDAANQRAGQPGATVPPASAEAAALR